MQNSTHESTPLLPIPTGLPKPDLRPTTPKDCALEKTTLSLLDQAESIKAKSTQEYNSYEEEITQQAISSLKIKLFSKSLDRKENAGLSAAFCLSLQNIDLTKKFPSLPAELHRCDDMVAFLAAHKEITDQLFESFTAAPYTMTPKQKEQHIRRLYDHVAKSKKQDNDQTKYLIAARLETLDAKNKATSVYLHLLAKRFHPMAQLANIIRIAQNVPESLYQIGRFIIETDFRDERIKPQLMRFARRMLYTLQSKQTPEIVSQYFRDFLSADAPTWDEIALTCIKTAVYNDHEAHPQAARYLSKLTRQGHEPRESPSKACLTLEFAYRHVTKPEHKLLLTEELEHLNQRYPEDPWVNTLLANFYTSSLTATVSQEKAQKAYELYQRAYGHILANSQNIYGFQYPLTKTLPKNTYQLAMIFLQLQDKHKKNNTISEKFLRHAEHLLTQSGKLSFYKSHWKLASLKEDRIKINRNAEKVETVDYHYQCALEAAMVALALDDYQKILTQYKAFVTRFITSRQYQCNQFEWRLKDAKRNIMALERRRIIDNPEASGHAVSTAKNQLESLTDESPLAMAIQWERSSWYYASSYYQKLFRLLDNRGLFQNSAEWFVKNIITLLTDYYILTQQDETAKVFFRCLKVCLNQSAEIDNSVHLKINVLIDFYLCILENRLDESQTLIDASPNLCKAAFEQLQQRILLSPEAYSAIHGILSPRSLEQVAFRPEEFSPYQQSQTLLFFGDRSQELRTSQEFIEIVEEASQLPSEQRQAALSAMRDVIQSAKNSPRDGKEEDNCTFGGSAPTQSSLISKPTRDRAVTSTAKQTTAQPYHFRRRLSESDLMKRKATSAPAEFDYDKDNNQKTLPTVKNKPF